MKSAGPILLGAIAAGATLATGGTAGLALLAGGTAMAAGGQISSGIANKNMMNFRAAQERQQAGQANATGQREAENARRVAAFAESKAQAEGAASGADAMSGSDVKNQQDIAGMGEYNALSALYTSSEKASGLEDQASADKISGTNVEDAGFLSAGTTAMQGGSMMLKYGDPFDVDKVAAPANSSDMPWLQDVRSGNIAPNSRVSY